MLFFTRSINRVWSNVVTVQTTKIIFIENLQQHKRKHKLNKISSLHRKTHETEDVIDGVDGANA